jgi:hypothetical protein
MANGFDAFCADHADEIAELASTFADYQPIRGVGKPEIMRWLRQFSAQHRELAIKLAQSIHYYGTHSVNGMLRPLKQLIDQQIEAEHAAAAQVFYLPGGRTAESGPSMLHRFRNMNKMQNSTHFTDLLEAPQRLFGLQKPVLYFLDDFVGTGKQICDYWDHRVREVIPEYIPMYFCVIAGFRDGIDRVEKDTPFRVLAVEELTTRHHLLGSANHTFNNSQKQALKAYCDSWGNHPLGHGNAGMLVSFSHGTPNNAPSVIRGSEKQKPMCGILPGWEDLP